MHQSDLPLFYGTLATTAATLIGLLFVAVSLMPERQPSDSVRAGVEVQASGCMMCFIDVLAVALFGLAKPSNAGQTALVVGGVGALYGLASLRSLLGLQGLRTIIPQVAFSVVLVFLFGLQVTTGLQIMNSRASGLATLDRLSTVLIVVVLVGVARTWQLVGLRDTGLVSSLTTILGRKRQ